MQDKSKQEYMLYFQLSTILHSLMLQDVSLKLNIYLVFSVNAISSDSNNYMPPNTLSLKKVICQFTEALSHNSVPLFEASGPGDSLRNRYAYHKRNDI